MIYNFTISIDKQKLPTTLPSNVILLNSNQFIAVIEVDINSKDIEFSISQNRIIGTYKIFGVTKKAVIVNFGIGKSVCSLTQKRIGEELLRTVKNL